MSFNVSFYSFSKRENSTKQPDTQATTFACVVRAGTGIIEPTIELDLGLVNNPSLFNYAFIPNFNRFYNIKEWVFEKRLWIARLKVDALATFKANIGAANLYVLRASAASDGNIVDTFYPAKANCTFESTGNTEGTRYWETDVNNGSFVLGVVSKNPYYGSLNYYVCDVAALEAVVAALMRDIVTTQNFDIDDASMALQLNLVDPLQYIKSCVYIPVGISRLPGTVVVDPNTPGVLEIFNYDITISDGTVKQLRSIPQFVITRNYILPQHPQAATRGGFLNTAPFTRHTLIIPPFGMIELDTTITKSAASVGAEAVVDLPTGRGFLTVSAAGATITKVETQIGVPVQLSQVSRDYLTAAQATTNGVLGTIGSALTGNVAGAIGSAANGIADATRAMVPRSSSMGSGGSYAQFYPQSELESQFFPIVDDDNAQNGRPLCQIRKPSALGGYMLIQDGDVAIAGTATEAAEIRNYLESGFYFE